MSTDHVNRVREFTDTSGRSFPQGSEEIRIVLIGKTGSGKSATGNTILQRDAYKSEFRTGFSVTKKATMEKVQIDNTSVLIVDTPGFFGNTRKMRKFKYLELLKGVSLSIPGPNAFLYVIANDDQFTDSDFLFGKHVLSLFGPEVYENIIIVVTRRNDTDPCITFKAFLDKVRPQLKELLEKCENRILLVDNFGKTDDKNKFISNLLTMIRTMPINYYSNEMLKEILLRAEKEPNILLDELRSKIQKEDWS